MKRTLIVLFWCGLAVSLSSFAQEMPTWDLSRDLQISFTQGSNGVWYFMESASRVHDPALYRLLPRYLAPCQNAERTFAGVGCWHGTEDQIPDCFGAGCGLKTEVAFNFTSKPVPYQEALGSYVPHMARLMATWDRYAIVAWQSPLTGFVKVSARFGFQNIIGIGMDWSVDKGAVSRLRNGTFFISSWTTPGVVTTSLTRLTCVQPSAKCHSTCFRQPCAPCVSASLLNDPETRGAPGS
jgi:hypothetical protein